MYKQHQFGCQALMRRIEETCKTLQFVLQQGVTRLHQLNLQQEVELLPVNDQCVLLIRQFLLKNALPIHPNHTFSGLAQT